MTDEQDSRIVRFSTAGLPEGRRTNIWREYYGHVVFRVDIEPVKDAAFETSLIARALPGLELFSAKMSPVRVVRGREFLSDGNDDFVLLVNRTGLSAAAARGREAQLGDGDAILMSSSDISVFERHAPGGSLSLRIPRSVLAPLVIDVDDTVMKPIPRHSGTLQLLSNYADALFAEDALATPEVRRTVAAHIHDLVALTLGATRDGAEIAARNGVPAARLRAAKKYIAENSTRQDLSVGAVAAHLSVTPRYVQRLFESDGMTFSTFLLDQRLARAHRMLTDPRFAHKSVGTIAYEVGFGDLSYFNRCFRRHFGAAPRDLREGRN